jgi:Putative lumazine-binding
MKKSLVFAFAATLCAIASAASAQQNASRSADDAAVRQAVGQYLRAHATGSGEHIKNVFHPELKMFFVREGQIAFRTAPDYIGGFSGKPAADEAQRKRRIENVDITGTAAVAKVVLDYPNATLTDYLSLVKANGEWKVVGKIFHSEPKR